MSKHRCDHGRLGFALQLTTAWFLGSFLAEPVQVPWVVVEFLGSQLGVAQEQLVVQRASHERAWSELRASHARALEAARAEVTEVLTARHGAELEGLRARAETAIARAEAQLTGAGELAQAQRAEITRLVAQVEDLRRELARARGEARGTGAQAPSTLSRRRSQS